MSKTALITGGASGIGKEFAIIHAKTSGDLVLVDIDQNGLQAVKAELQNQYGVDVFTITKDLSKLEAPKEIYAEVQQQNIQVDYLINNAGFGGVGAFHERPWEKDLAMIQVNVIALAGLTRCFLPDFVARDSGKILNVSSAVSLVPGPMQIIYFATKAFVTSFSKGLAGELLGTNVSATALLPGATKTKFGNASKMNTTAVYRSPGSPQNVAQKGYDAMLQGKVKVIANVPRLQRAEIALAPLVPEKLFLDVLRNQNEVGEESSIIDRYRFTWSNVF